MKTIWKNLKGMGVAAKDNAFFLLAAVGVVIVIVGLAYVSEQLLRKRKGDNERSGSMSRVHRMTIIAMLTAIAEVLMLLEFPLTFLPAFYEIDFSELPVIIGACTLGPVGGVLIEFLKVTVNLFINGTATAFVGEFANFCLGCGYVVPAAILYYAKKTKKSATVGLILGTCTVVIGGCFLNAFLLLPAYGAAYGMDMAAIVAMGSKVNGFIENLLTFVVFAVVPFNFIKYGLTSVVTLVIYKKISHLLKRR